jgi:uncharacterized protein related to proFAR isomerase
VEQDHAQTQAQARCGEATRSGAEATDETVKLQDVFDQGVRYLTLDELAELYARHEILVAAHTRCLDDDDDIKTLDCWRCGLTASEQLTLVAQTTQGSHGMVLTQTGIDLVQETVRRMRQHREALLCCLDLDEVCRVTGADRSALEAQLPQWRSLLALGA